jgi:hypothetical protein
VVSADGLESPHPASRIAASAAREISRNVMVKKEERYYVIATAACWTA